MSSPLPTSSPESPVRRWIIPAAAGLLALLIWFAPAPRLGSAPTERLIRLDAMSFEFTPSIVTVNPGDTVTLELASHDYVHGLYVDSYGVSTTADPGQPSRVTFVADMPGVFTLRCSVSCGPLHPFMVGRFNVGPNWLLWRAAALAVVAALSAILTQAKA